MIGLDKVTGKLRNEAAEDAARTIAAAEEKCRAIAAETEEKIEKLREAMNAEIEAEGANIIERARSAAATEKRNILLSAKGRELDSVFAAIERRFTEQNHDDTVAFLLGLARGPVAEAKGCDCRIRFNSRDRAAVGEEVLAALRAEFPGRNFVIDPADAAISGGLLLDFGETDVDCSVGVLLAQYRPMFEGDVCRRLFENND